MSKIAGVSERDIDLLLLEEFIASSNFQQLFINLTQLNDKELVFVEANRSVTDYTGESDLEITFQDDSNYRYILLIENKVNANFQKDQLKRYIQRGQNYIKQNKVASFKTVLVAPKTFHNNDRNGFDFRINYEDIIDYFKNHNELGNRSDYKILLLKSAIEKSTNGYQMEADLSVTQFWHDYWLMTLELAKEFYMDEPGFKPSSSSFIYFKNVPLPPNVDLVHKMTNGHFDIQFNGMGNKLNIINDRYANKLENNMRIIKAGKSAVIRIKVPKLSMADTLESQKEKATQCLIEGKKLLAWFENQNKYT